MNNITHTTGDSVTFNSNNNLSKVKENKFNPLKRMFVPGKSDSPNTQKNAVKIGNPDVVHDLLKNGGDPNAIYSGNISQIAFAAKKGNFEIVKLFAEHELIENSFLIQAAIHTSDNDIFDYLVNKIELGAFDKNGRALIHSIAKKGDLEKVIKLVEKGADINLVESNTRGFTPLLFAVEELKIITYCHRTPEERIKKQLEVIKYLVEKDANPSYTKNNCSALSLAVEAFCIEAVEYFLPYFEEAVVPESGIFIEDPQLVPWYREMLFSMKYFGTDTWFNVLPKIHELGGDLNIKDQNNETILYKFIKKARKNNSHSFFDSRVLRGRQFNITPIDKSKSETDHFSNQLKSILELEVDPNSKCGKNKETALHWLLRDVGFNDSDIEAKRLVAFFVENRWDIDSINEDGDTVLHLALERYHLEYVEALIKNRADLTIKNSKGKTPQNLIDKQHFGKKAINGWIKEYRSNNKE